ncbi:hypothetical protein NDU88_006478 [Pleurodeles waltl]|uniref:Uncharacterized protein n=1 Tax=Pleurodeles waltl TaxID=8319 RepID=A0AAV7PJV2_PLEWA|nr:hypothetical protein NDU88_006478 [Pleurodeles waltl]
MTADERNAVVAGRRLNEIDLGKRSNDDIVQPRAVSGFCCGPRLPQDHIAGVLKRALLKDIPQAAIGSHSRQIFTRAVALPKRFFYSRQFPHPNAANLLVLSLTGSALYKPSSLRFLRE